MDGTADSALIREVSLIGVSFIERFNCIPYSYVHIDSDTYVCMYVHV